MSKKIVYLCVIVLAFGMFTIAKARDMGEVISSNSSFGEGAEQYVFSDPLLYMYREGKSQSDIYALENPRFFSITGEVESIDFNTGYMRIRQADSSYVDVHMDNETQFFMNMDDENPQDFISIDPRYIEMGQRVRCQATIDTGEVCSAHWVDVYNR